MDTELRIKKIQEIVTNNSNKSGSKTITYKSNTSEMLAYKIPVEYLIFNQYNGRIGTFVKTYEKQYSIIDATTSKGEELIVDFLWKSKISDNKIDYIDIEEKGQMEVGIITKDGVIVDGNRRCMLLKKLAIKNHSNPTYFRAIILPDKLEDSPKDIRKLETEYQMGARHPVNYNAIEKYLKCKDLSQKDGFTNDEIAKMMGEKSSNIKKYLNILTLMEEYLQTYGYEEMYTRLEEESVEGPFDYLVGYLEAQKTGRGIQGRDWSPDKGDLNDLKNIYFDYIRAGLRTKDGLRFIGNPSKSIDKQGFFNKKDIWKDFVAEYETKVCPINDAEKGLEVLRSERPDEDITDIIRSRDEDWKCQVVPKMKENLGKSKRKLDDDNESDSPMVLLQRAFNSLSAINKNSDSIKGKDVRDISHKIRKIVEEFIKTVEQKAKNK